MNNLIEDIIQIDKKLLVFLNNLGSEQWDSLWLTITNQLNWIPLFLLIFFLIIKSYGWKRGGFMILAMVVLVGVSDQFTNLVKNTVQRLRPNNDPQIYQLLRNLIDPQSYSFMSGHATTSTFFTIFAILLLKEKYKYPYFLLLFPAFFSYSRLYLGVHFPIDIIVGILIGVIFGNLYFRLYQKLDRVSFN
ncbi:phosphatase PAP2 family protein [Polaribacter aquimarinus]|uniref:phosphatase PAP2 family protein n=1 Tax=Polaribacter aquimarinus TaxID=2100726 RepID=UPI001F3EDAF4|nr:phosphatase PAP2 family protein [Polaribacter aquimarinus]